MAVSTWWRVPCPSRDGSKWPLNLPRAQDPSGIVSKMDIFWIRCPLIDRRRAASYSKIGRSHFFSDSSVLCPSFSSAPAVDERWRSSWLRAVSHLNLCCLHYKRDLAGWVRAMCNLLAMGAFSALFHFGLFV